MIPTSSKNQREMTPSERKTRATFRGAAIGITFTVLPVMGVIYEQVFPPAHLLWIVCVLVALGYWIKNNRESL